MYEALFNLVNVWSLMLWPLMLADKKGAKVKNKFGIYLGTQVLSLLFGSPTQRCDACSLSITLTTPKLIDPDVQLCCSSSFWI